MNKLSHNDYKYLIEIANLRLRSVLNMKQTEDILGQVEILETLIDKLTKLK